MDDIKKTVAKIIVRERKNKNLSQKQLADLLDIDRQYMSQIELGKINMTLEYLQNIIRKIGSHSNDFFNSTPKS